MTAHSSKESCHQATLFFFKMPRIGFVASLTVKKICPKEMAAQLLMALPRFDDLPALDLPRGVRVRNFRPGDAREWDRIVGAAFGWTEPEGGFFNARMRQDTCFRPERVWIG